MSRTSIDHLMNTHRHTLPGRLFALLITTAVLAGGLFAARADAAPLAAGSIAVAPSATVAPLPTTSEFRVTTMSRTTIRLVGQGRYTGITIDAQPVDGTFTAESMADWVGFVVKWAKEVLDGGSGSGAKPDACTASGGNGTTVPVSGNNNTITINVTLCSPK